MRTQDKVQWCECCGHSFFSSRYDARFCSASCRSKSYRQHLRARFAQRKLENQIIAYLADFHTDAQYQAALESLQRVINANSLT